MSEREYPNPIDAMREIMAVPQHLAKGKELIAQYEQCTGWCELVLPEVDGKPVVAQAVIRHAAGCVNGRIDEIERGS